MSTQYKNNAYHEAGHAVIAHLVGLDCIHIEIQDRHGFCVFNDPPDIYLRLRGGDQDAVSWAKSKAVMLAGGAEAERVLLKAGSVVGDLDDRAQIGSILFGLHPAPEIEAPSHEWSSWERKDREMRRRLRRRARRLVVFGHEAISVLAQRLIVERVIAGSDVTDCVKPLIPCHQDWSMVGWLD